MRTWKQEITEILKQKKNNSWTAVCPTRTRASGTNRRIWRDSIKPSLRFSWFCVFFVSKGNPYWLLLKVFRPEPHRDWVPTRWRAIKEGSKVFIRDYVNYHACSLSYYIYIVPKLYIQLTLVISTSLISNNRLSRSENLVPAYTWKPNNR